LENLFLFRFDRRKRAYLLNLPGKIRHYFGKADTLRSGYPFETQSIRIEPDLPHQFFGKDYHAHCMVVPLGVIVAFAQPATADENPVLPL
jgi:hypothetical protein